jgi:hypothetical protein
MRRLPWRLINRGDLAVFHLGGEVEHHGAIWRLLQAHSGIAVLHDTRLHELFLHAPYPMAGEDTGYVIECERFYGRAGRLAGEIFRGGLCSPDRMATLFPMLEPILEAASGVLVQDENLAGTLTRRTGPPVVSLKNLLEGGKPEEFVRGFFRFAASADSGYARSLIMAKSVARAMKMFAGADEVREGVLERAAQAVSGLVAGPYSP